MLRETFVSRRFPREPEPDLVMDDPAAVQAFSDAGRVDGPMAAYYIFHTARASQTIAGCRTVLDLGCGPATQLAQIAELNPDVSFLGVDLSDEMLAQARAYVAERRLTNVRLMKADITSLACLGQHSVDGVISTMSLHHLPTPEHLRRCFREIRRVLKPEGAVYLVDFGALKSLKSVLSFAYMNADHQPYLFSRDYERSLRAAFRLEDFREVAQESLTEAEVRSTFKMPILVMVKTADRPLAIERRARLRQLAEQLSAPFRRDLADVRLFFKLDGLGNDPFGSLPEALAGPWRRMAHFVGTKPKKGIVWPGSRRAWSVLRLGARIWLTQLRAAVWTRAAAAAQRHELAIRERVWTQLAETLLDDLGALKGPWMKFGQMASYMSDRLPQPIRRSLTSLQDRAVAVAPEVIRTIVERELHKPIRELFLEWHDAPLAAASISQLHLARLHSGEQVVVKVKYPRVEEAVRSDLTMLRLLSPLLGRMLHIANFRELLDELAKMVEAECDFRAEADHQERFRRIFETDPEIFAPRVYRELSTDAVLTMEYVEGSRFAEFRDSASAGQKSRAARTIARAVVTSFHRYCFFNADPHPGNYLFAEGGRVCFLDFGFTKRWTPELVRLSKRQSLAGLANDTEEFTAACRALGYGMDGGTEAFRDLLDALRGGTYGTWLENRPFRYSREFVRAELSKLGEVYRRRGPVRLSAHHLPFHRVFWGHHFLFADLEAEFNLHEILVPLLHEPPLPPD
ncbi:MAG TPA: AarF/UbiB family protein [Thermoanaerobaculia bacterium]|nr:AarF/UbiB family protein [Thermoanaerobaculia bacterium]